MFTFEIIPVNIKDKQIIDNLVGFLSMRFNARISVSTKIALGEILKYYNESRGQLNALELLNNLQFKLISNPSSRFVIMINSDAYVEDIGDVFGISKPGWGGIVFIKRLNPIYYGYPFNVKIYTIRIIKQVVHELGHSLGLPYCNNRRCIMSYINNIFDLDNRLVFLCRKCQLNLERLHPGILKFIV